MNQPQLRTPGAVSTPESPARRRHSPRRRGRWEGWVGLGAVLMMITGGFAAIQGLVALLVPSFFVTGGGRVLALGLAGWGWLHLVLGVLVAFSGVALLASVATWARAVGAALVAITVFVQLVWLPAFPAWSIIIIGLDLLVLYAIATTWNDWRTAG